MAKSMSSLLMRLVAISDAGEACRQQQRVTVALEFAFAFVIESARVFLA